MTSSQVPASLPALTSDLVRLSAIPSISAPGYTVFPGMVTSSGDLVILAVQRQGEPPVPARRGRGPALDRDGRLGRRLPARGPPRRRRRPVRRAAWLTAARGQLISNMATALIVIPIAVSAAVAVDVSAKPVLMAVIVSVAASFLTRGDPPANLMVTGRGGYRSGDDWKLGLPMLLLFGAVAVLLVPLFGGF